TDHGAEQFETMARSRLAHGRLHRLVDGSTDGVRAFAVCLVALPADFKLVEILAFIERLQRAVEPDGILTESGFDIRSGGDPGNVADSLFESKFLPARETGIHTLAVQRADEFSAEASFLSRQSRLRIRDKARQLRVGNRPLPKRKPERGRSLLGVSVLVDHLLTSIEDERERREPPRVRR